MRNSKWKREGDKEHPSEREKERGEEIVIHTNIETLQQPAYFEFDYNHKVTYPFTLKGWVSSPWSSLPLALYISSLIGILTSLIDRLL